MPSLRTTKLLSLANKNFVERLLALVMCLYLSNYAGCAGTTGCPSMCTCIWKDNKQIAQCDNQGLISIPSGISSATQVLDLAKNNFQILPEKVFQERNLINLQKIFLNECKLGVIAPDAFLQLINLVELDLSSNLLTSIPVKSLRHCPYIRKLFLNGNPIQQVKGESFSSLNHLTLLDLSDCQIDLIEPGAFKGLVRLEFLKLYGNRLTTLSSLAVRDLPPLYSFDLHQNPWNCDCELRPAREWMITKKVQQTIPPTCTSPEKLKGLMWNSLGIDDFACPPIILSREHEVSAYSSTNASFTCTIKAIPEAKVMWLVADLLHGNDSYSPLVARNDKFILTEERPSQGLVSSTLYVLNVDTTDSGLSFGCFAENQAGAATKKFNLTLLATSHQSMNQWTKMEIAAVVISLLLAIVVICVFVAICLLRRAKHFQDKPQKESKPGLSQMDVLNAVKQSPSTKNDDYGSKFTLDDSAKIKIGVESGSAYGYTPDITSNAMNASIEEGYNPNYTGLLQVSSQQHAQQRPLYNNYENYNLYDYSNENYGNAYDHSYETEMTMEPEQNVDPNYWGKRTPLVMAATHDTQEPNSQHHVNVVGQGSYNIGHPTVVRYSPDEGYAEEPAVIPYNLQGTEV